MEPARETLWISETLAVGSWAPTAVPRDPELANECSYGG